MATLSDVSKILAEIAVVRAEITAIRDMLIGSTSPFSPPGLIETIRVLKSAVPDRLSERLDRLEKDVGSIKGGVRWASLVIGGAILLDAITRVLSWYRGQ